MDGFDESASLAVCRRVPSIRPKRKSPALSNQKELNEIHCGGQRSLRQSVFFFHSIFRHWHGPLLRQSSSYLMYCRTDWATVLTAVSDNCS